MPADSAEPALGPPSRPAKIAPVERVVSLLALLAVELLYVPINRLMQGGVSTRWPLVDDLVPLWPAWVVPYLLALLWWNGCFIWAAWKMDDDNWRALVRGAMAVMLSSYLVYVVWPSYVLRKPITESGWAAELLRTVYANDRVYNALPSGHTYSAVLVALFWSRWLPRWRWLWIAIAVVIVLSTLFTGQHYVLDLLAGVVLAWLGYRFGLWAERWPRRRVRRV